MLRAEQGDAVPPPRKARRPPEVFLTQRSDKMTLTTEHDVAEAVKHATGALRIKGGGTRDIGALVTGETLDVSGLRGISLYEPGALTLVAQAGTPVAEIEAALEAENQRLAFEPMDHRVLLGTDGTPTIGGVVAANVSGPRRIAVGACRDHMLGVRFVDGAGTIIKNGGRVMKNVTGYDLVKLLTGSYGTLGVLTEVSLKVLPRPETGATLVVHGLDVAAAVSAMSAALGSPFEVTGAAHADATYIRIEGFAASVSYRTKELSQLLTKFGEVEVLEGEAAGTLWDDLKNVTGLASLSGDIWRISVQPSAAPDMIAALPEGANVQLDWGGGLIWACVPEGSDIRPLPVAGHATLVRASEPTRRAVPVFEPQDQVLTTLTRGLRARFDPRGILNPGLMG
ncbi:putative FAD-linked oxidoreductase [Pseudooctadecabacter jejudonensis]|uniref:Putative FAD-linked oxidoreductase n=2 Tax=Pseudooctadecabacter jejudonensis TaxID=1391910 RepID=A0A1Y5T512_9RHOB|nr:putative FAD-linked oxidoreductase [Pseudooctadecabacter jejudonensis]